MQKLLSLLLWLLLDEAAQLPPQHRERSKMKHRVKTEKAICI
jgi:hypothetical protein